MGVHTVTGEFTSPVPAKRLFRATAIDFHKLLPKIIPQAIKTVERIDGDGGPGTLYQTLICEDGVNKLLKSRIDALDKEKMIYKYTVIDGDGLSNKMESVSNEIKLEATPDGGCKGTYVTKYYPKPGFDIDESKLKEDEAKAAGAHKAVEAYLLANPNVCA